MLSATLGTTTTVAPVAKIYGPNRKVSVVAYNMGRFAQGCVIVLCELPGCAKNKVGTAPTPFLDEAKDPLTIVEDEPTRPKKKGVSSTQAGTPERCVFGASWDPTKKGKADVSSAQAGTAATRTGVLSKIACKVLMKILDIRI